MVYSSRRRVNGFAIRFTVYIYDSIYTVYSIYYIILLNILLIVEESR